MITAILFFNVAAFSQARYAFIDYKDAQKAAVVNDFSYQESIVSKAIQDKMQKLGYKGKESKSFIMYKNVTISELGNNAYDLYFKIDRKSRKEKDVTSVTMLLSKGNETFVTEADDAQAIKNAKYFLDNLIPNVQAFDLQKQITDQEDVVKKTEKKYKNLLDDADDLQKRKRKIEQQIEENIRDQKDQQTEIEKQKQLLQVLQAKRK